MGFTELCGKKGSGRTNLAIDYACSHNTAYISSTPFPIRRYFQVQSGKGQSRKLFISEPRSVAELWLLVKHRLGAFVAREGVELVVIDSLDHLLCTERKDRALCSMLVDIVRDLKDVIHRHSVPVVVVNSWRGSRKTGSGWSLGLSWSYLVNTRVLVRNIAGERTCEDMISATSHSVVQRFVIHDQGISFKAEPGTPVACSERKCQQ